MLIHVEVQTAREAEFPQRMYVYNYRIFDRYNKLVASLAVLADDEPKWRPEEFRQILFGCETGIRFPTVKLLDLDETALEESANPFSKVVIAHLKARQTLDDPGARHTAKIRLVRGLYERGFSAKDVRELFRVIDWLMVLPPPLAEVFQDDVEKIQKEKHMPFVTSIEQVAERRALRQGIEVALKIRFGDEGLKLMPEIREIYDQEQLRTILTSLETIASPNEVRRLWSETPAIEE